MVEYLNMGGEAFERDLTDDEDLIQLIRCRKYSLIKSIIIDQFTKIGHIDNFLMYRDLRFYTEIINWCYYIGFKLRQEALYLMSFETEDDIKMILKFSTITPDVLLNKYYHRLGPSAVRYLFDLCVGLNRSDDNISLRCRSDTSNFNRSYP